MPLSTWYIPGSLALFPTWEPLNFQFPLPGMLSLLPHTAPSPSAHAYSRLLLPDHYPRRNYSAHTGLQWSNGLSQLGALSYDLPWSRWKEICSAQESSSISILMGRKRHHLSLLLWSIIKRIIAAICQYLDSSCTVVLISFKNSLA